MPLTSRYLAYKDLVDFLKKAEKDYPDLVELESIGKSYEGRDIWEITITQKKTGNPALKPAIYIDGNHHAGEVTGSAVCLYTIEHLLQNYATNPESKTMLDAKTFYIVPRISPDGAELYLSTPFMLRSSVRPYPDEDLGEGLVPQDVDGDGFILQMKWEDPAGQWKMSEKDSRVMARRRPGEVGGKYFRVVSEGLFQNFDGVEIKQARPKWGLDLNRNYPGNWHAANQQTGPGPFPFSEPETRAVGDFLLHHPNIAMSLSYHTSGGYILRARTAGPDRDMPQPDLTAYLATGRRGQDITGYPCVSIFEGFTADERRPSTGSFIDFAYDIRGIPAYAVELWDLQGRAGVPRRDLKQRMTLSEEQAEDDDVKVMAYIDKELASEGFHAWKEFNHPQLGKVEIGGLDPKFMRQNPPVKLLEQECHKNCLFSLMLAQTMPGIGLLDAKCEKTGDREYGFSCAVKNAGYLPTSATQQAQTVRAVKPIKVKVALAEGVTLLAGKPYDELPHLPGWGSMGGSYGLEKKIRFVFKTDSSFRGKRLATLTVETERAGIVTKEVFVP